MTQKYPYDHAMYNFGRNPSRAARKPDFLRIGLAVAAVIFLVVAALVTAKWWNVWAQNISSLFIPDAPAEFSVPTPAPAAVPPPTPIPTVAPTPRPSPMPLSAAVRVTPTPSPTPSPTPVPINDDWNYMDKDISISITPVDTGTVQYFVADIKLSDVKYFKTAVANDELGSGYQKTSVQAKAKNAILAVSGDYCGFDSGGVIIRNGEILRDSPEKGEMCLLYDDGRMDVIDAKDADGEKLIADGVLHSWTFGPWLVKDSQKRSDWTGQTLKTYNPRCAIGMITPLHYVFVIVDGRSKFSKGMMLDELAATMHDMGCEFAYNLDGGGTATMIFRNRLVNRPLGKLSERSISDIVYIGNGNPLQELESP